MTESRAAGSSAPRKAQNELVIMRVFDAPRERVWRAWSEPEQVKRWWGPEHFTAPFCKIDFHVGGTYLFCMRSPEGQDFWSTGVYREIVKPERIVYTDSFADEQGKIVPGSYYGMGDDFPTEMLVTVSLEAIEGNRTRMTLRHAGMPAGEHSEMASSGWNTSLDKLANSLK